MSSSRTSNKGQRVRAETAVVSDTPPMAAPVALEAELGAPRADLFEAPRRWSVLAVAWFAIVTACNFFQPWQLGFYLDDWGVSADSARFGAAFSFARLKHMWLIDQSRPGLALIRYVCSSLLADSAMKWQFAMLLANVAIAVGLYRFIRALDERISRVAAASAAALWLVEPWLAANRFWNVLLPVNVAVVLFCFACIWAVEGWKAGRGVWIAPGLAYLACCLCYEAFYLQFVPLAMIGAVLVWKGRAKAAQVARTCAALVVGQVGGWLWKTYGPQTPGMVRPAHLDTRNQIGFLASFIAGLPDSFPELAIAIGLVFIALVALCALLVRKERNDERGRPTGLFLAACAAGPLLCMFGYIVGGVQVSMVGTGTRAMLFFGFWAVVAAGLCVASIGSRSSNALLFSWTRGLAFVLAALLAASYWIREQDWEAAWRKEQLFLSRAPVGEIVKTPNDGPILYVGPTNIHGAPVFAAPWDLDPAMKLAYPALKDRDFIVYNPNMGMYEWDGTSLKTSQDGVQIFPQSPSLYIWEPARGMFYAAPKYTKIGDTTVWLPQLPAFTPATPGGAAATTAGQTK